MAISITTKMSASIDRQLENAFKEILSITEEAYQEGFDAGKAECEAEHE